MPIKVGVLITSLAKKSGIDPNTIAIPHEQFDLPDDFVAAVESKLLTEDAAKNSPALKSYFRSQALDGVDLAITRLTEEFQFDDEAKTELSAIKSTYDKIPALAKVIQALESKKAGANKGQTAQLQEQINKLNEEKAKLVKDREEEIAKMQKQFEQNFTDSLVKNKLAAAPLLDEQFGKEVMLDLAYKYLLQELSAKDAKAVQKDGVLKLVKASDEALDFYADNKPVTFDEFQDTVLAKYKLIAVNKNAGGSQSGTQHSSSQSGTQQSQQSQQSQQPAPTGSGFAALIAKSQADLQGAL